MKVYAVGTSCTWFERNNTSFIIDDKIVFDTPAGSYKDILKKVDIFKLSGIIISHFHADHFGDLHIFATRYMRESEMMGRTEKMKIYGPKGMLDKIIEINTIFCSAEDERDREKLQSKIDFIEIADGDEFVLDNYKIKVYEVDHGKAYCLGFTFEDENGVVVGFSADTRDCENLRNILKFSEVAFVDLAAPQPAKSHLDCQSFVELQKMYPNCKMYPIHTSDQCLEFVKNNNLIVVNDFDEIII